MGRKAGPVAIVLLQGCFPLKSAERCYGAGTLRKTAYASWQEPGNYPKQAAA